MRVAVVHEERYWYPDDGGIVWVAGYMPVDPGTRSFLGRDALRERGLISCGVAGAAAFHDEVLQSEAVRPGAKVRLRRDPANEHDPNAIAVEVAGVDAPAAKRAEVEATAAEASGGGEHLGFVPRDLAVELAPKLDAGEAWSAVILREQRGSPRDPRTGVTMLLAPDHTIELDVR
ncbi:MAG TPA: HIRAN domain-containing protein [Solirubrobacteraceae bacterium]